MTLTLVQSWTWPQLQEEIYFLIILPGRSSLLSTYPICIHWWSSSFQKWFWRKSKRRIRKILYSRYIYIYIYIICFIYIFSFVVEWFAECCRRMLLTNVVVIIVKLLIHITLYYYTIAYYIILDLTFILLLIYNLFKGSNGKVKLERSRLWQLDNSIRKTCERG